jgi:hypothetical protein
VHNGPSAQTVRSATCCGSRLQVVALTSDGAGGNSVELVRCTVCAVSTWRLDGQEVDKRRALGALSAAFAPAVPRPPRPAVNRVTRPRVPAPAPEPMDGAPNNSAPNNSDLAALLSGWRVLGSHG